MVYEFPEHPFRRADGTLVFLHSISVPLFGIDDNPEFLLRISEDVTSRRRQQKELRAKTAELHTVSDASPLGMFRTDAEGRRTYVNRSYELLSGLSAEEALAGGWTHAIHADDRDRVVRQWEVAVREHQPFASLHRYQHRDGRVVWVSVKAVQVEVDGNVAGYVGSVDDFTARREAEHALQASERRLQTITDTMPAWIAYIDRQEIYRFTNAAFERAFNLTREQVQGRTIRDVLGEAGYQKIKPYLSLVFGGQPVTFEREQLVADGIRWVEATWIPEIDENNNEVVGFHAMLPATRCCLRLRNA
jgi:PAS domain S-box-containing protein